MKLYSLTFVSCLGLASSALAQLPQTGGDTTTHVQGSAAFSQPASNMPMMQKVDFSVGNSFFKNPWVPAPSSTTARDGLGPLFNTNGCQSCHIRDGRGHAPLNADDNAVSMLMRLSIAAVTAEQQKLQQTYGPIGEPTYGGQLQDFAIQGVAAEGQIQVQWQAFNEELADGTLVAMRRPVWSVVGLNYGELHADTQFSPRIAPQMIGLGLLELISEQDILALADEQDANNDGISGRANWVWDVRKQDKSLGRFGWKAGMPTLEQQNAGAFNGDVGITSELFMQDHCSQGQNACLQAANGNGDGTYELQDEVLQMVTFYTRHLAVPKQRVTLQNAEQINQGDQIFAQIGCQSCHVSEFTTMKSVESEALSEQTIHPFTDLLLHDLGEGLADNREEFLASGQEWRTPPLWGLGYFAEVSGELALLHDGRAQTVEQAILWHGGEALNAQQAYKQLPAKQRQALLTFLHSL